MDGDLPSGHTPQRQDQQINQSLLPSADQHPDGKGGGFICIVGDRENHPFTMFMIEGRGPLTTTLILFQSFDL